MASLLAIFSSILWGTADFFGGKLSKRYQAIAVTAVSQAFGLLIGILIILVSSAWLKPNLSWDGYFLSGIFAGLLGFIGLVAFYSGLFINHTRAVKTNSVNKDRASCIPTKNKHFFIWYRIIRFIKI